MNDQDIVLVTRILADILAAQERTALAVERLVEIAEKRQQAKQEAPRADEPTRDLLSVTGFILNFGEASKLTKKGAKYWSLKLTNGFEASVFKATQAKLCERAAEENLPLIIDYEKKGQYSNIDSIKLGRAPEGSTPEREEGAPF